MIAAVCRLSVLRGGRREVASAFVIAPGRLLTAASAVAGADGFELVPPGGAGVSLPANASSIDSEYSAGDHDTDLAVLHAWPEAAPLPLQVLHFTPADALLVIGYPIDSPEQSQERAAPGALSSSGRSFRWLTAPPLVAAGAAICVTGNEGIYAVGVHLGPGGGCLLQEKQIRWALTA